ncbi:MAG: hypothetical protein AAGA23_10245 [Pseudomonadota bacterium]
MIEEKTLPAWFNERIEPWLDGDLAGGEAALFEARLADDKTLRREVQRARALRQELAALPGLKAPRNLSRKVLEMTGAEPRVPLWGWATGAAMAASLALVVTLSPTLFPDATVDTGGLAENTAPGLELSDEELARATAELRLALGYLDRAGEVAARQVGAQTATRAVQPVTLLPRDGETI